MEFAESTDKEKPIPKELTAFLNEVQNNLGLYPETVIYNRIKEYISVIPRKQVAWLTQTVIISTEFRVRILSTRCKSGDKLACEMLDLAVNGDEYSKNPTVQKGLMGLFRDENDIESGKLLVEIGVITQEQYDKEIRSRKQGDLIDGKSYPDLLNDLAAESKKYPTADSFSMAMIMGKLESVPSPNTANVYKLIRGKYKTAEDFYNAVKKGEFEIKKTEERKERMVEPEEAVSKPLIIKGVEDLELMKKEIQDKITEEKRRRLRGGGMAGEIPDKYVGNIAGEPSADYIREKLSELPMEERKKLIESIWSSLGKRMEPGKVLTLDDIYRLSKEEKIKAARILMGPEKKKKEVIQVYKDWTFDDFKHIISRTTNLEDLLELEKHISESEATTPRDRIELHKIAEQREVEIRKGGPDIRKQIEEQERGGQLATAQRLKENQEDYTFSKWTYDDFKTIINRTANIEDLMKLAKHIEYSSVMTPGDKVSARQLIEKRKRDIVYQTPEVRRQTEEQEMERKIVDARLLRDDDIKKDDDVMHEPPEDYKLWTFADFEPFIYNEDDIDELGQLQGIVNLSNRLTETEKTELHDLIDKQIGEILARR